MAANKTFTELDTLATVDKANDWLAVVDVSDTTASTYGTTKKANVDQFIGPTGAAATVDAGTTTTGAAGTDASVVNAGTTSAAVFNFTIPRGNTGATGAAGSDGADGDSAYVYIAYASDASGADFTTTFSATLDYIAIKTTTTEITTPQASDFTGLWKNYKGAQGIQGIQGETGLTGEAGADGTDGANAYVYIAYASDSSGTGFTTTFDTNLDYVAIKATTTEILTPQASDFTGLWKNYKGATGTQGLQGVPGVDGADGLDINWLGVYDAGTSYVINDAVFYEGSSYICIAPSTGNLPTDTTYWDLMAQQGAAGSGSGDVSGPSSATDNAIARFDLATGKLIQNSLVTVDDNGSVNIPAGQQYLVNGSPVEGYSDEQAQDAVGTILTDTTTVDFTYTDETPSITADVKDASVANAKLANMATKTYKGRTSATTGVPEDVAVATLKTDLGLVKGDVGLGNVDNTSDATKNSATVTLTNKTIDGDANTISNLAHGAEVDNPTSGVHGVTGSVVGTTDTQTLSAKTLTSPVIDTSVSGTAIKDEDDMASDSASHLATQQSIKAYVDAQGFTWEGAWATSTPYSLNDTVESGGSGYVCISAHTSGASTRPGVGANWATVWGRFVQGINEQEITELIRGGWSPIADTWTYNSTDNPTGVINWTGANSKVSAGMRIRFDNGGNTIYGIVTAVTGSTMTFLHEMNEANNNAVNLMANSAITNAFVSSNKAPLGFNLNPSRWSVELVDIQERIITTVVTGTWYALPSPSLVVPVGLWSVYFSHYSQGMRTATPGTIAYNSSLSSSSSSETNTEFTSESNIDNLLLSAYTVTRESVVNLSAKTTFYPIMRARLDGIVSLRFRGHLVPTVIKFRCAYL